VEGIDISKIPVSEAHDHDFDPIVCCEQLINEWTDCPVIELNKDKACYIPSLDKVQMPGARTFFKDQEFYSVLFHEMTHNAASVIMPHRVGRVLFLMLPRCRYAA
jgi:antirestriction protein ArdC